MRLSGASPASSGGGVNDRIAAPVDEGAEHRAVAEPRHRRADPVVVEAQELGVRHFAGSHRELAVAGAGDVAFDLHVIGLVAEQQLRLRSAVHQPAPHFGVGRVAASKPMTSKQEDVAEPRDSGRAGRRRQRARLDRRDVVIEDNLIDLVKAEARDLNRSVLHDQLAKLDLELVEVPAAFLAEPVDREAKKPLLVLGEMFDANARNLDEPQQPRRLDAAVTVEHDIVCANEDRGAEP